MDVKKCMGGCEQHHGDVILVRVVDPKDGYEWGDYWYCEEAIRNDVNTGFTVTPVTAENCLHCGQPIEDGEEHCSLCRRKL